MSACLLLRSKNAPIDPTITTAAIKPASKNKELGWLLVLVVFVWEVCELELEFELELKLEVFVVCVDETASIGTP